MAWLTSLIGCDWVSPSRASNIAQAIHFVVKSVRIAAQPGPQMEVRHSIVEGRRRSDKIIRRQGDIELVVVSGGERAQPSQVLRVEVPIRQR